MIARLDCSFVSALLLAAAVSTAQAQNTATFPSTDGGGEITAAVPGDGYGPAADSGWTNHGSDREFTINVARPMKVGQRMIVRGSATQQGTITNVSNGREHEVNGNTTSISFDGVARVLEVDAEGWPTAVSYEVENCTVTLDGTTTELASKGSVLEARRSGDRTTYRLDRRQVNPPQARALDLILGLDSHDATDGTLLQSAQPRTVGESWAIDADKAARGLQWLAGRSVSSDHVSGLCTLVDVENHESEPCLVVFAQIFAENVMPTFDRFPADADVERCTVTVTHQGLYPVRTDLPAFGSSVRMDIDAVLARTKSPSSRQGEMHFKGLRVVDVARIPLSRHASVGSSSNTAQADVEGFDEN
jgi:hypothetical protein